MQIYGNYDGEYLVELQTGKIYAEDIDGIIAQLHAQGGDKLVDEFLATPFTAILTYSIRPN